MLPILSCCITCRKSNLLVVEPFHTTELQISALNEELAVLPLLMLMKVAQLHHIVLKIITLKIPYCIDWERGMIQGHRSLFVLPWESHSWRLSTYFRHSIYKPFLLCNTQKKHSKTRVSKIELLLDLKSDVFMFPFTYGGHLML